MSSDTCDRILQYLQEQAEPQTATEVSAALGFLTHRQINPSLYKLLRNGKLEKGPGTPPTWTISKCPAQTKCESSEAGIRETDVNIDENFTFQLADESQEEHRSTFKLEPVSQGDAGELTEGSVDDRYDNDKQMTFDPADDRTVLKSEASTRVAHEGHCENVSQIITTDNVLVSAEDNSNVDEGIQFHMKYEDIPEAFSLSKHFEKSGQGTDAVEEQSPKSKSFHDENELENTDDELSLNHKRTRLDEEPDNQTLREGCSNVRSNTSDVVQLAVCKHSPRDVQHPATTIPQSPAFLLANSSQFTKKEPQSDVSNSKQSSTTFQETSSSPIQIEPVSMWQPPDDIAQRRTVDNDFQMAGSRASFGEEQMDFDEFYEDAVDNTIPPSMSIPNPKNPIQENIVRYLKSRPGNKEQANKIAQGVGFRSKKDVNRELYDMSKRGLLKKVQESPPVWELAPDSRPTSAAISDHPRDLRPQNQFRRPLPLMSITQGGSYSNSVKQSDPNEFSETTMRNNFVGEANCSTDPLQPLPALGRGRGLLMRRAIDDSRPKNINHMPGSQHTPGTTGRTGNAQPGSIASLYGGGFGRGKPPTPAELLSGQSVFSKNDQKTQSFMPQAKCPPLLPESAEPISTRGMHRSGPIIENSSDTSAIGPDYGGSSYMTSQPKVRSIFDSPMMDDDSADQQQKSLMSAIHSHEDKYPSLPTTNPQQQSQPPRAVNTPSFSLKGSVPPSPRSLLGLPHQPTCPTPSRNIASPPTFQPGSTGAISNDSFAALNKNSVSALMEYAQARKATATVSVVGQRGPSHNPKFRMAAFIGTRKFPWVECSNKKDGKKEAADIALRTLMAEGEYKAAQQVTSTLALLGKSGTHFDKMAALAHGMFNQLAVHVAETMSGRKILAAIVMTRGGDQGTVISLGTGNRCITGNYMSLEGQTINDSHAEIISRRGLIRFLYRQIMDYVPGDRSGVLEQGQGGRLKVKDDINFHLYISTAPCGDGALFSPRDAHNAQGQSDDSRLEHQPIFSSKVQGVLRTKMEGGEGTIPIEADFKCQTWDGILQGGRLRTMSCSDKICRWNIVGMQGALLSHFLEPVYLDSLTLGLLYDHGHLSRAVCCRLSHEAPDLSQTLPAPYRINHPRLGRVTVCDAPRETQKTKEYSINWCVGDDRPEVVDGTKGICVNARTLDGQVSRVAKCSLHELFKSVCQRLGRRDLMGIQTYGEAKSRAIYFQNVKSQMVEKFRTRGYGPWVSKPQEEEMFS